jgi:hypothetical protein
MKKNETYIQLEVTGRSRINRRREAARSGVLLGLAAIRSDETNDMM